MRNSGLKEFENVKEFKMKAYVIIKLDALKKQVYYWRYKSKTHKYYYYLQR